LQSLLAAWCAINCWLLCCVRVCDPVGAPVCVSRDPVEAMEIRVAIKASDARAEGDKVTAAFKEWVDAGAWCGACAVTP
jgi:hypothetical protein